MRLRFQHRLAPGLPRDWNDYPVVGGAPRRRFSASGWFALGVLVGMALVVAIAASL